MVVAKQITYAYEVWFPDLNCHGKRRLKLIQRTALQNTIKVYMRISTDTVCVITVIPPRDITLINFYNCYQVKEWPENLDDSW